MMAAAALLPHSLKTASGKPHLENRLREKCSRGGPGSMVIAASVRRDLDEAWELQLALGDFFRPDAALLAVVTLPHQAGNQAPAVFDRMGELIVLTVKLDA